MQKVYHLGVATGLAICLSAPIASADVTIDRATKYQIIEGFGFFGAADACSPMGTSAKWAGCAWL